MRKVLLALGALVLLAGGVAWAQNTSFYGAMIVSPVPAGPYAVPILGPSQTAVIQASGGTLTCTSGGTIVVANTNIDAGSVVLFGMKTVGGTPSAQLYLSTYTAATSMTVKCSSGDTSVYNYLILG